MKSAWTSYAQANPRGAFNGGTTSENWISGSSYQTIFWGPEFDANSDNADYGNPMAGHATSADIHPYAICLIPVIAF